MIDENQGRIVHDIPEDKCYLPARYVLTILLFCALLLEHAHRACLGVAIVAMVNHTALDTPNGTSVEDISCVEFDKHLSPNQDDSSGEGEYVWTPTTQGGILGAYFGGYIWTQVLGGRLAEKHGGKWPLGLSILVGSILTIFTPLAADCGVAAIVIVRILMGLFHGICFPTTFAMLANWAPEDTRSSYISVCITGNSLGTILSMAFAGYLCDNDLAGGWPSVFYILGGAGVVWFLFWICLAYNDPNDHPRISNYEKSVIQEGKQRMTEQQRMEFPWRQVPCSGPVWSVAIAMFCAYWGYYTLLTKLPTYLEVALHVSIKENGGFNGLVYTVGIVTTLASGGMSDYLHSTKGYDRTTVRKGFEGMALLGPALFTVLIPLVGCQSWAVILLLTLAMTFLGLDAGGHVNIVYDMAPNYSATIFGLVNGFGCMAGVVAPLAAGAFLDKDHSGIKQWSSVFYLSAALYLFGAAIFLCFASAEIQPWAQVQSRELSNNEVALTDTTNSPSTSKEGEKMHLLSSKIS